MSRSGEEKPIQTRGEVNTNEIEVTVSGLRLAGWRQVSEQVDKEAKLLFGLHGWLDNAASFVPLAKSLPSHSWEAFDLSGHGRSDHKTRGAAEYTVVDWALEVCLLLESLGGPKRVLVGHSLGAGLAGMVAAFAPERVEALVCLDGLSPLSDPPSTLVDRARTFLAEARAPRTNRLFRTFESLVAQRAANGDMTLASAQLLMERARLDVHTPESGVTIRSDVNLKRTSSLRLTDEHLTSVLSRVECPTLLIDFGGAHFRRSAEAHERLLSSLPNARVVSLPGGHHLHMDAPLQVAPLVEAFLAGL
ncbi:MAG: alpha/beta hydrolase [Silvanigrellales bacterium]|nr:alpha/beta hydrolase [Silvanigrellales bacterium]